MKALVIYCHPRPESFTAAVRDTVVERLTAAGAEVQLRDLYALGFDPVLSAADHAEYNDIPGNRARVEDEVAALLWADTLIFIYPTWWYGLPAMLKGWLDRVFVPEVAFLMPKADGETIRPGLGHLKQIAVYTTCGASWWLTRAVGAPGRRTLLRGIGWLAPKAKKSFAEHYLMDSSTDASRAKHLARIAAKVDKLASR